MVRAGKLLKLFARFVAVIAAIVAGVILLALMLAFGLDLAANQSQAKLQFSFDNQPNDAAFSPDGRQIAVAAEGYCRLHIFDTDTGRQIRQMELCPDERLWGLSSVNWSPDGERIVVTRALSRDIWIVDVSRNVIIQSLIGHSQQVRRAAYSHDGHYIVSYGDDGVVLLWDAETGRPIHHLADPARAVTAVAFSPDDSTLATAGSDGVIRLWAVQTGAELEQLNGHESTVYTIAFSSDGQYLASGGIDNTARVWRVEDASQLQLYENPSWVMSMCFLDGRIVLFSNWLDGGINLWDIETNEIVEQFNTRLSSGLVSLSSARSFIATIRDYRVELWEILDSG